MDTETNFTLRIIRSGIYLFAILAMFVPIVLLAMGGAFMGELHQLYINVVLGLCATTISLLAFGFAALLSGRKLPSWLVNSGPVAACALLVSLPLGPYRESVGRIAVILPALLLSTAAILIAIFSPRELSDQSPSRRRR